MYVTLAIMSSILPAVRHRPSVAHWRGFLLHGSTRRPIDRAHAATSDQIRFSGRLARRSSLRLP